MNDLFSILPRAILYLASGFTFLCGYYLWSDRRFDFFSDISFSVMLVIGYLVDTIVLAIPYDFGFADKSIRNLSLVCLSFVCGMIIAIVRNGSGSKLSKFVIKHGRRKSSSEFFWYDILDDKDRPLWIRLANFDKKYILDGVLLSLSETQENPYLLLGYCMKYDLDGKPFEKENVNSEDRYIQKIVRPDSFDEITVFYADGSSKGAKTDLVVDGGCLHE